MPHRAALPAALHWRFEHVGGGALIGRLRALAQKLGIADRVTFLGAKAREEVIAAYERSDVFALASRIARNGDRDGLPNVVMEAMTMGLPVVSTAVSALPEIVTEDTGILVPERDPDALADALTSLARDPARRQALGAAGAARVRAHFSPEPGLATLRRRFAEDDAARRAA